LPVPDAVFTGTVWNDIRRVLRPLVDASRRRQDGLKMKNAILGRSAFIGKLAIEEREVWQSR
jgi:hypothetical protein